MGQTNMKMQQRGTSLIEVLVAMIVLSVGLLGLVGLQARLHVLQMESYQRAQGLILLHDMATRMALNRNAAVDYVTANPVGFNEVCPADDGTRPAADLAEWCVALQGAAEVTTGGTNVGVMVGGRGCVESLGADQYLVTVAWQGLAPLSAPPEGVPCGEGDYDGGVDSPCIDDLCRRVVTTIVRIANLT